MTIWFTADQHFCHGNIIRYCKRPFYNILDMNEELIFRFNKKVRKNDIVYFLGDFGLGPKEVLKNILSRLNGKKKILIRGNHDRGEKSMMEIGFDEVHRYVDLSLEGYRLFLSHISIFSAYHDVCISGHCHDLFETNGNIINVGVDVRKFEPISWKEIKDMIDRGELNRNDFKRVESVPDNSI